MLSLSFFFALATNRELWNNAGLRFGVNSGLRTGAALSASLEQHQGGEIGSGLAMQKHARKFPLLLSWPALALAHVKQGVWCEIGCTMVPRT